MGYSISNTEVAAAHDKWAEASIPVAAYESPLPTAEQLRQAAAAAPAPYTGHPEGVVYLRTPLNITPAQEAAVDTALEACSKATAAAVHSVSGWDAAFAALEVVLLALGIPRGHSYVSSECRHQMGRRAADHTKEGTGGGASLARPPSRASPSPSTESSLAASGPSGTPRTSRSCCGS